MALNLVGLDHLPPVVQLLLREGPPSDGDLIKHIRRLIPDLRKQARWTLDNAANYKSVYFRDEPTKGLTILPASGLDPFSDFGKCTHLTCRVKNAEHIARTVGVYADQALIGDYFTTHVYTTDKWNDRDINEFIDNIITLLNLAPLFATGIFRFIPNTTYWCQVHSRQFYDVVDQTAEQVLREAMHKMRFEKKDKVIEVDTGGLLGTPKIWTGPLTKKGKRDFARASTQEEFFELVSPHLRHEIGETLFKMRVAERYSPVTFTNSRLSALTARRIDSGSSSTAETEIWEESRSAHLPWVNDLPIDQILPLREQAKDALPRFRARMARAMTSTSPDSAKNIVDGLKEEALEVESELKRLKSTSKKKERLRNLYGFTAMSVVLYGFAAEAATLMQAVGTGGLMGLFKYLHDEHDKEQQEISKQSSRPGYVVVKAKELAPQHD